MTEELLIKIEQINALLRAFGPAAVQEIKMMKNGKVVGQIRYGYKPQYIFDAVNYIIRPENWRYEIISKEIFEYQAVVEVKLFIKVSTEWLCKGSHTGQMNIINKNVGDAYKGAATDALQKCFSVLSIGCDAYRGLLQSVYQGKLQATSLKTYPSNIIGNQSLQNVSQLPPVNHSQQLPEPPQPQPPKQQHQPQKQQPEPPVPEPPPSSAPSSSNNEIPSDLPELAGIEWEFGDGIVFAKGKTYNHKSNIKSLGFRWDGKEKYWYKELAA